MNCPYCDRNIYGLTGLQELQKFNKHLQKCRKNPANEVIHVGSESGRGRKTILLSGRQTINDALRIRAESGQ